jgi:hypothetical protein
LGLEKWSSLYVPNAARDFLEFYKV